MRRFVKWFLIIAVVVGVISAASYPAMTWWQERSAPKYLTAKITRGRVETVVNSTGTIKPVRTVSVGAFTSGPIKEVKIDFNSEITQVSEHEWLIRTGAKVEKVKWLALIDDKLQAAAVDRDEAAVATQVAELERIKAILEEATIKKERAEKVYKANPQFISDTEMDQLKYAQRVAKAQLDFAKASIVQAKANLKNSKDQLDYTKIVGPKEIDRTTGVKGQVLERKVDPGQTVVGNFQTPELFTIALEMDKHLYVYASVDEADIGLIRAAGDRKQVVKFRVDAYPAELFEGTIYDIRLNSTTTQNVVTYPVIIDAPNRDQKLKPGMTANITFPIDAKENVLRVPASALRFTPLAAQIHPEDRHYVEASVNTQAGGTTRSAIEKAGMALGRQRRIVWKQDGPLLRAVPVTLGLTENRYAELLVGDLNEGDVVVTGVEGAVTPR